jgi:hypothetical protein
VQPLPLSETLHGDAKQAYESAKLLAQNNDFAGALEEFTHAYNLSRDPRLLYNMAICDKGLHHYAKMKTVLEQYLQDGGGLVTPEARTNAQDALAAIRALVASLKVNAAEAGAEVLVDGVSVGTTPIASSIAVDLGQHKVTVKKEGFETFEQSYETPGGTEVPVSVTLRAVKHSAQLVVSADSGATIMIDGQMISQGRFDGAVSVGPHHLNVSESGKQTYRADVDLRDGETRQLQVTLEEEKHGGASPWPWIIGIGGALLAGGAVTAVVVVKSQDQSKTTPVPAAPFGTVMFSWGR